VRRSAGGRRRLESHLLFVPRFVVKSLTYPSV
jgi:hypothetical protein